MRRIALSAAVLVLHRFTCLILFVYIDQLTSYRLVYFLDLTRISPLTTLQFVLLSATVSLNQFLKSHLVILDPVLSHNNLLIYVRPKIRLQ